MKPLPLATAVIVCSLILVLACAFFPRPTSALKPLDDDLLTSLSPATVAPPPKRISIEKRRMIQKQAFEHSICFKRCHQTGDFKASDKTAKQWQLLIEENGHAIFDKIPWESPEQKKQVLDYLIKNAPRGYEVKSEGIGVWK